MVITMVIALIIATKLLITIPSNASSRSTCQVYIFMFNIGYGSLVWMTATEILPAKIRSSTNGLTVRANADLVIKSFFALSHIYQSSQCWGYSCQCNFSSEDHILDDI